MKMGRVILMGKKKSQKKTKKLAEWIDSYIKLINKNAIKIEKEKRKILPKRSQ